MQPQDRRLGRLRLLLLGGVSWAALNRRDGQGPAATVEARAGAVTVYRRRHNNPAVGPVGDSLDDLEPPLSARAAHSQQ